MQHSTLCLAILLLVGAEARAQSGDSTDVFKKVQDPNHTSVSTSDVFRRAAQAKEAAETNRPDAIATDPNQVEAQVVRRDSIDFLHRAPATSAPAAAPAAPPVPAGVPSAIANAFSSAPDDAPPAPAPAPVTPKPRRATHVAAAPAPAPPAPAAPKENATAVQSGSAPALARMGAAAPPPPPKAVFGDTMTTLEREAATVSHDVAPKYAAERTTMDSVRSAHNARLDSLEATENVIPDSSERKFEHKMAEAARIKNGTAHSDSTRAKTP
jgi:hypothetical protein